MSSTSTFIKELGTRRTIYSLSKENFPVKNEEVVKLVEDVVAVTPSSFNNQTNRAIVLFGTSHEKLWDLTHDALKAIVSGEQWAATEQRIAGFKAGYGTVLFFQDTEVVAEFEKKFATYAANFAPWAEQSSGAAQINTWTGLALLDVGANLQHYNQLIEKQVSEEFKVPSTWKLSAQLVFGTKAGGPLEKTTLPAEKTVKVFQ